MSRCEDCRLHETAITNCIQGRGPRDATIMVVGEAPGKYEDTQGKPFVGKAGQYLEGMLRDAGFDPAEVFFTNAVRCRPPENRDPKADEIDACRKHLAAEIAAIAPEAIIALGNPALQSLTGLAGIMSKRGQSFPLHKRMLDLITEHK